MFIYFWVNLVARVLVGGMPRVWNAQVTNVADIHHMRGSHDLALSLGQAGILRHLNPCIHNQCLRNEIGCLSMMILGGY